jgi:hypothetical protein
MPENPYEPIRDSGDGIIIHVAPSSVPLTRLMLAALALIESPAAACIVHRFD